MRLLFAPALLLLVAAPLARADGNAPEEPSCTTSTTTTTTCRGSAAPLAAPGPEIPQQAPPPQYYPPPPPQYYPPGYIAPPPYYLPSPKMHVEERPIYGLVIAGLAVWGGVYLWNVLGATLTGDYRAAIPIAGPILLAADRNLGDLSALFIFDALLQGAGAAMFFVGLVAKHQVTVYDRVALVPMVSPNGSGLAAMGSF